MSCFLTGNLVIDDAFFKKTNAKFIAWNLKKSIRIMNLLHINSVCIIIWGTKFDA